jgi:flagellar biosynthesis/type III secretory pathway M-ring protein FliF/YscJ
VLLNLNARPRGFARSHPESSAGVTLFMKSGEPVSRSLALAAARMVAGAVRGLPVKNVQVVDGGNGRVALEWDEFEGGSASNLHRQRKVLEREKEAQIKEQLSFDRNVLVSVSYDLDHTSLHVQDSTPSEGPLVKEQSEETSTVRKRRSEPPGVEPNVGLEANGGSGADTSTSERRESVYTTGVKTSTQDIPPGAVKQITAAVSLSYSYLAGVFRLNNPDAEPPAEAQIEDVFAKQKAQIAAHVAKLVKPPEPEQVSVVWHYDILDPQPTVEADTLDASLDLARKYGPASALGLLALVALGMMMRLARQRDSGESFGLEIGLPEEAIEAARKAAEDVRATARRAPTGRSGRAGPGGGGLEDEAVPAAPLPVGQASETVLDAQEVDESAVRINHMVEQVAEMTERDSDSVATLMEKWIDQSR